MGCSCGLSTGEGLESDALEREKDVRSFLDYLSFNRNKGLKLYATWWENWDLKTFPKKKLELDQFDIANFSLEEDVILLV